MYNYTLGSDFLWCYLDILSERKMASDRCHLSRCGQSKVPQQLNSLTILIYNIDVLSDSFYSNCLFYI